MGFPYCRVSALPTQQQSGLWTCQTSLFTQSRHTPWNRATITHDHWQIRSKYTCDICGTSISDAGATRAVKHAWDTQGKKDVRITFFSLPDRGRFKYHGTSWQLLPPVPAGGKGGAGDCSRSSSWCGGAAVCYCLPLSTGCMQLQSWQLTENKRGGGRGGEEVNKKETLLPYPRCSCNA